MSPFDRFDLPAFVQLARSIGTDTRSVEVKTASGGLPRDVVETISAFANTSGGTLVCGLSEKNGFAPADSFDAKHISDALAQACAEKLEPPVRADIDIAMFEGAPVVVANVPETPPYLKPCYVKARTPYDGSFVRGGDGDRRLSRYEVDRLLENREQPRFDERVIARATSDELDPELVRGLLLRERGNSPRVFGTLSEEDALVTLGILDYDDAGVARPTVAGLMALGRHPQRYFPRVNVAFAVFPGPTKASVTEAGMRFLDSRTIVGPIPVMVAETLLHLRRHMNVASYMVGAARQDRSDYPEVAVREAVANALMHRDYSPEGQGSPVQVSLFTDHLEIINPGGLFGAVTVNTLGRYGISAARNQRLSRLLESTPYPSGYPEHGYVVENKGTGFAQIQASLRAAGLEPARAIDELSVFVLEMSKRHGAPPAAVLSETTGASGQSVLATVSQNKQPDHAREDDAQKILASAREHGFIQTSQAAELLGVSPATALRRIACLVNDGLLVKSDTGGGRSTRYVPVA